MKKVVSLVVLVMLLSLAILPVCADHTGDSSYVYNFWSNANPSLSAFELSTVINSASIGEEYDFSVVSDVYCYDGKIYIADSGKNCVYILNSDYSLDSMIKVIRDENGRIVVNEKTNKQMILSAPEGVFVNDKYIYIADTGNGRVLILEHGTHRLVQEVTEPDNMVGSTEFLPYKIAVDKSDRMFVVVKNSTEGIVELNKDGSFASYFGVNSPTVNLVDIFWKSIASDEQKAKMNKVYAPAFSNVQTDNEGFVYAVTLDTASQSMVFRMNSKGENVLRQFGYSEQMGDVMDRDTLGISTFVDIAVSDYGVYALLDATRGRVFLYNFDGNLLSVFGGMGDVKGMFQAPSSISWMGDSLVVGDSNLACAFVFTPTEFGSLILQSEEKYYNGDFSGAAELNQQLVHMNANYDHAYVSIGKNLLMQDEYEQAMYYFKLGNDKTYYSKAFAGYRNLQIQKYFFLFALVFVLFVAWVLYTEVKHSREQKKLEEL